LCSSVGLWSWARSSFTAGPGRALHPTQAGGLASAAATVHAFLLL